MLALRGYSNGRYVIPKNTTTIPENVEVIITFLDDAAEKNFSDIAAWQEFLEEIKNIHDEPVPEFERVRFREVEI